MLDLAYEDNWMDLFNGGDANVRLCVRVCRLLYWWHIVAVSAVSCLFLLASPDNPSQVSRVVVAVETLDLNDNAPELDRQYTTAMCDSSSIGQVSTHERLCRPHKELCSDTVVLSPECEKWLLISPFKIFCWNRPLCVWQWDNPSGNGCRRLGHLHCRNVTKKKKKDLTYSYCLRFCFCFHTSPPAAGRNSWNWILALLMWRCWFKVPGTFKGCWQRRRLSFFRGTQKKWLTVTSGFLQFLL